MSANSLAARLAEVTETTEIGRWQRHAPVRTAAQALDGWGSDGRWGTADGFPVLYLGRPTESVIVEAYRHLVDPVIFEEPHDRARFVAGLMPRVLVTCTVQVTALLDLRRVGARAAAQVTLQELTCTTDDRHAYRRCQEVAQVAHQLGRHGILAPAATGIGDTLALFPDRLPAAEQPVRAASDVQWPQLPPDPREGSVRRLRVVKEDG